jgi:hypothetical protein
MGAVTTLVAASACTRDCGAARVGAGDTAPSTVLSTDAIRLGSDDATLTMAGRSLKSIEATVDAE